MILTPNALPAGEAPNDECRRYAPVGGRESSSRGTLRVRSNQELEEEFTRLRELEEEIRKIVQDERMPTWIWGEYRWLLDRILHKLYRPLPGGNR